jgi:hypothetical protein
MSATPASRSRACLVRAMVIQIIRSGPQNTMPGGIVAAGPAIALHVGHRDAIAAVGGHEVGAALEPLIVNLYDEP